MAQVTKTIHPLPFEHLDPKRFEDLARQLTYDFRNWQQLEPTGRAGSDDGYDIRGWEIVGESSDKPDPADNEASEEQDIGQVRRWLIQCKRERTIGPAKIARYFDEISAEQLTDLYGVIFVAACDFSKKARDTLRERCREAGIAECHIWGKGDIEGMLFQPKNDGVLFAYFGISLVIRRRSIKTNIRSRLAMKRKLRSAFGESSSFFRPVLLLDPEDNSYPYREDRPLEELSWQVRAAVAHDVLGLEIVWKECPGYLHEDGTQWDMANKVNVAKHDRHNPWLSEAEGDEHQKLADDALAFLQSKAEACRASIHIGGLLAFDDIVEVDKDGDPGFRHPIIYVSMKNGSPNFRDMWGILTRPAIYRTVEGRPTEVASLPIEKSLGDGIQGRIEIFPKHLRSTPVKKFP